MSGASGAGAWEIQSHRATYDWRMTQTSGADAPSRYTGQEVYVWRKACGGWTEHYEVRDHLVLPTGLVLDTTSVVTSFESDDGLTYSFEVLRDSGPFGQEHYAGEAQLKEDRSGYLLYDDPQGEVIQLPPDTQFPTSLTVILNNLGDSGGGTGWRPFLHAGSPATALGESSYFVEAWREPEGAVFDHPVLEGRLVSRTSFADYASDSPDAEPETEHSVIIFDDGIVHSRRVDYGGYVIEAVLVDLELLEDPVCQ